MKPIYVFLIAGAVILTVIALFYFTDLFSQEKTIRVFWDQYDISDSTGSPDATHITIYEAIGDTAIFDSIGIASIDTTDFIYKIQADDKWHWFGATATDTAKNKSIMTVAIDSVFLDKNPVPLTGVGVQIIE